MSTVSTQSVEHPRSGIVRLYYPEFGIVEAVLGYAVFYYVVDLLTGPLTERLTTVFPDLGASAITTMLAVALWAILGLTVLGQLVEQTKNNPRTFASVAERDDYLARHRPSQAAETLRIGVLAVGVALVALTWEAFPAAAGRLVAAVIGSFESLSSIGVETVVVFVAFAVGTGLANYALDRLLVGGLRASLADARRGAVEST